MPQGVQLHLGQRHLPVKSAARPKTCGSSSGAGQGAGAGWSQTKGVIKDCVADAGGRLGTSRAPAGTRFVLRDLMERGGGGYRNPDVKHDFLISALLRLIFFFFSLTSSG